jgi:phosphoribosylaminoimidazolecarboxamide formyltransferase/IMP cyclohydrolase
MNNKAGVALISVYDKESITEFAQGLFSLGWKIYASGGTAQKIRDAKIPVSDVSELVGGSAILGHRVVSLSREVYAGLLADKNKPDDVKELEKLSIPFIDLVCVDMYPLEEEISKKSSTVQDVIEKTDIGGPTLLRAAAKGRRIVLSASEQRKEVLDWLNKDRADEKLFLEQLAARAEYEVTRYTMALALYLNGNKISGAISRLNVNTVYGENPQQSDAGFYSDNRVAIDPLGLDHFEFVKGFPRSYINMTDIDRLLQMATHIVAGFEHNFDEVPAVAIGVKHGNACGAAVAKTHAEAAKKMIDGDIRAIFGGVIMITGVIDEEVADVLMHYRMKTGNSRLLDGVIGAGVTDEALAMLVRKKLRVVINPALAKLNKDSLDSTRRIRLVRGGMLSQPNYTFIQDLSADYMQFHGAKLTDQQKRDMILGWAIGSTSNSNTIAIVKEGKIISNGVGQQDRIGASQLALTRTTTQFPELTDIDDDLTMTIHLRKQKLQGAVAYSDSFFPFPDGPELLAHAGVTAILTTSGSVADDQVIEALTKAGVSLAMVPDTIGRGFFGH